MSDSMISRVARAIEEAARKSVPWPDREMSPSGWMSDEDDGVPQTLENFVQNTYIGPADEVFKAAAAVAARAAIQAMREPTDAMICQTCVWTAKPTREQSRLAQRAIETMHEGDWRAVSVAGDVVRDWHSMIDAALKD